jgi:hypothetical protein
LSQKAVAFIPFVAHREKMRATGPSTMVNVCNTIETRQKVLNDRHALVTPQNQHLNGFWEPKTESEKIRTDNEASTKPYQI